MGAFASHVFGSHHVGMRSLIVVVSVALSSGCNVFFGLDSVDRKSDPGETGVCDDTCACTQDCEFDCTDCAASCASGTECIGTLANSTIDCADDSSCEVRCSPAQGNPGTCEVNCPDRGSDCFVECPEGAECLVDCGDRRVLFQRNDCAFVACDAEQDCGDGVFVCNRECPL